MRVAWSITVELSSAKECPLARQKLSQPPNLLSFEAKAIKIAASNIETSKQVEHRVQPCLVLFKELRVIKQVTYLIRRVRASSCVCHPCARIHSWKWKETRWSEAKCWESFKCLIWKILHYYSLLWQPRLLCLSIRRIIQTSFSVHSHHFQRYCRLFIPFSVLQLLSSFVRPPQVIFGTLQHFHFYRHFWLAVALCASDGVWWKTETSHYPCYCFGHEA